MRFSARPHHALGIRVYKGESGTDYRVFRNHHGEFHVFAEVQAKEAAQDCGTRSEGTTQQQWEDLWNESTLEG